ncbi:GVQW3 protein, partial [Acromyrmex heyeri]
FYKNEKKSNIMIKFLHLKGNMAAQIKVELNAVYEDFAPSFATVKRWIIEFKRDCTSLADDEHSRRSKTVTTTDNIEKVYHMILDDCLIKVREIAEVMNISKERVYYILTEELDMRKLTARWYFIYETKEQSNFQGSYGIVFIDYLKKDKIMRMYYALIDKLKAAIAKKLQKI